MKFQAVFFDLDGTLLPMDQEQFTKCYFSFLTAKLAPHGYDPKALIDAVWKGTAAMVKNDGSQTNEAAFWRYFVSVFGETAAQDKALFEEFYRADFQKAQVSCGFQRMSAEIVHALQRAGTRVVLATNPIFPAVATESRIRWAGLEPSDFELVTTYENSRYCKPNPAYYRDIAERLGLDPTQCLMVGNDATEDLAAAEIGMQVFLVTDCLINSSGRDISAIAHGGFAALKAYLAQNMAL